MKSKQLLLIFTIICYSFSQTEVFDCEGEFENIIKSRCEAIDSCSYNKEAQTCIETHACSYGNEKTDSICRGITPIDFHLQRCILDTDGKTCKETPKECSYYNRNLKDDCSKLSAPTNKRCVLVGEGVTGVIPTCVAQFDECSSIRTILSTDPTNNECNNNIPKDPTKKCNLNTAGTEPVCEKIERYCSEALIKDIDNCHNLPVDTDEPDRAKKQCIYKDEICQAEYVQCEDITIPSPLTGDECQRHAPLNADKDDYNYEMTCVEDTSASGSTKCKSAKRKCDNSNSEIGIPTELLSEEFCNKLEVTEPSYQKCVYDVENQQCKEEYQTCEAYITNKVENDRTNCESIVLSDKTKKCVYIPKEDKCETRNIYTECKDYTGKDKKICESIKLSPNNRPYCILDKDSECIEKPLNCSEARDEEECLKIAKASDSNKRCAYKSSKCYEEYIRCEDLIENPSSSCSNIQLYNGKKCAYESSSTSTTNTYRCRTNFKTCSETNKKEECKLIAKTGVTNPDRRVCDYTEISSTTVSCFENYKYCSDYRGGTSSICTRIKPYDETGENIDIGYKCTLDEPLVGCQKVPVECKDAGTNPILCELYSQYIKDKDKKYCYYDGSSCKAHFKKCEDFESTTEVTYCYNNFIEGSKTRVCESDGGKCVAKNTCAKFTSTYTAKELICKSLNPNCTYTSDKCEFNAKSCDDIKFYSDKEGNKEICENMEVTDPRKKCVLKDDKTGCKVIYRELEYSTAYNSFTPQETSSEGNSSGFTEKGIHLIMALLCLLI